MLAEDERLATDTIVRPLAGDDPAGICPVHAGSSDCSVPSKAAAWPGSAGVLDVPVVRGCSCLSQVRAASACTPPRQAVRRFAPPSDEQDHRSLSKITLLRRTKEHKEHEADQVQHEAVSADDAAEAEALKRKMPVGTEIDASQRGKTRLWMIRAPAAITKTLPKTPHNPGAVAGRDPGS